MPAILRPQKYELWLDPSVTDPDRVLDYLTRFDATLMKKYPVNRE